MTPAQHPILNGPLWRDLVFMGFLATVIVGIIVAYCGGFGW